VGPRAQPPKTALGEAGTGTIAGRSTNRPGVRAMERKWWTLTAVCLCTFMLMLDITVVNVALPAIQQSLHSSFAGLQWVIDAYALTLATFLLTAGVIGDVAGRMKVYAVGVTVFTVSSLLCGLSTSALMLDLSRGAQGVGGAIMFATSLALVAQAFSGRERGTAFGIYGAVIGGAVAIGPLLGGAITSGIGWRWIFFLNLPLGLVAIVITLAKVEDSRDPTPRSVDWIGLVTFCASLFMLAYALVQGNSEGWRSPTIVGLLIGSGGLMVAFLVAEWLQRDPMLDLSLFKRPAMVGVSLAAFTLSASIFAMFLYLTLYLEEVLGYGPFAAGLRFLPITVLAFAVAPFSGKLTVLIQSRFLLSLGLALIALGCALSDHVHATSTWMVLLPGFILAGIGIGIINPVLASATVSVVPPERSGMASGSSSTFRQVGIATGIAAMGAVFLSQIRSGTVNALARSTEGRSILTHSGSRLASLASGGDIRQVVAALPAGPARATLLGAYQVAFTSTFNHLMEIALVIALVGAVGCFFLVRQRDFVPSYAPDEASVPAVAGRHRHQHSRRPEGRHRASTPAPQRIPFAAAPTGDGTVGPLASPSSGGDATG
jgi:EmrB/QacA subfamily drug resistance transporter